MGSSGLDSILAGFLIVDPSFIKGIFPSEILLLLILLGVYNADWEY